MYSVYFVTGVYGVGKTTLCNKLRRVTGLPAFSAGDLISEINGETYGKNKVVKDVKYNQDILLLAVETKLQVCPEMILAGHFCIVSKNNTVELLPDHIFDKIHLRQIILLEADVLQVAKNIKSRDQQTYPIQTLEQLIACERMQAQRVSQKLMIPLTIYNMHYDHSDEYLLAESLLQSRENVHTSGYE